MLLYLFPVDVLSLYFSKIHGLLEQQGYQWKGLACVSAYCLCRLLYKLLQANYNKNKRLARKMQSQDKYDHLLQALDELEHPVDMSVTDLSFDDLCALLKKQPRSSDDVLLAFRIRAVRTDVNTNAIVALLSTASPDVLEASDRADVAGSSVVHTSSAAQGQANKQPHAGVLAIFGHCFEVLGKCRQPKEDDEPKMVPMKSKLKQKDSQPLLRSIPISLAEVIHLQGMDATAGLSSYLEVYAKEDAVVVQVLKAHGAIPVMRTNVPQTAYFTRTGVTVAVEGQNAVATCVGPISSEVAGLVAFMKCLCVPLQHQLDPTVSLTPFSHEMYESTKPLCVGFFIDDGHTKCVPSVRRALMEAKVLLENIGYKVVPFEPPDLLDMLVNLYLPAVLGDHYFKLLRTLCVDRVDSCVRRTYLLLHLPHPVRWLWSWWFYMQNPVNSSLLAVKYPISVSYWWKLMKDVTVWKRRFVSLMAVQQVDVLLCPVLPFAAVRLGNEESFTGCLTYSVLFNLLDFPAGTVPVSTVTAGDIADLKKADKYKVETSLERQIILDQLGYENQPGSSSQNLPVGVQIASLPYQDEMVLRVLRDLEKKTS